MRGAGGKLIELYLVSKWMRRTGRHHRPVKRPARAIIPSRERLENAICHKGAMQCAIRWCGTGVVCVLDGCPFPVGALEKTCSSSAVGAVWANGRGSWNIPPIASTPGSASASSFASTDGSMGWTSGHCRPWRLRRLFFSSSLRSNSFVHSGPAILT